MRKKRRSGFTLVEVIIAFVLLSLIAVMVMTAMSSAYLISSRVKDLPNSYYGGQDKVEAELDELRSHVRVKYELLNEINATAEANLAQNLRSQLRDEETWLQNYATRDVTLFGKEVELYQFATEYTSPDSGQSIILHAGVVNAETLERRVPILDSVTISAGSAAAELYDGTGKTVSVSVNYDTKNAAFIFRTFYQWYIATSNFHTAPFSDGQHYDDAPQYGGSIYTVYPSDFTILTGENGESITIKDEYLGKMLVCVATPLSKNGAMGESMVSNTIYLSSLPDLSLGGYTMLIDPSIVTYDYTGASEKYISSISSRQPASGSGLSGSAVLSLDGEATGSGAYSRFLSFRGGGQMFSSNFSAQGESMLIVVARNNTHSQADFITADTWEWDGELGEWEQVTKTAGFRTKDTSKGNGDWKIITASLGTNCFDLRVGGADVDVAELIVIQKPSDMDVINVVNYMEEKYGIE